MIAARQGQNLRCESCGIASDCCACRPATVRAWLNCDGTVTTADERRFPTVAMAADAVGPALLALDTGRQELRR